jgi:glycosyltransferase involved in cell wall biosynthesis
MLDQSAIDTRRSHLQRPSLSVVMPAFNEAENLPATLRELVCELRRLQVRWEVIVVDDGSRDRTVQALGPWLALPGVRCLVLSRNFGKEAALTAGLERARGDVVLLMDADGQHPVALIAQMLQDWRQGADMVCAVRSGRDDESSLKRLAARLFYRLANAGSVVRIPPDASDFRLMDRCVVDALRALPERNRFMKGLFAWVGFETRLRPYTPGMRHHGRSSFSPRRLLRLGLTGLTAFSNLPLRIWSAMGALVALLALAYGGYVVFEHFVQGHPVPGWATLVASLMFFSGVQLLSIGILGEYVGRIFDEVKQRPVYIVSREIGLGLGGLGLTGGPAGADLRAGRTD